MLKQLEVDQRFQKDPVANHYIEMNKLPEHALGITSAGAIALGALSTPVSPILIVSGVVGGTFFGIFKLLDMYSNLSQGNFSETVSNIGDIMTSTPGTGVNQP